MLRSWVTFGKHWDQDLEPSVAWAAITIKALLGLAGIQRLNPAVMDPDWFAPESRFPCSMPRPFVKGPPNIFLLMRCGTELLTLQPRIAICSMAAHLQTDPFPNPEFWTLAKKGIWQRSNLRSGRLSFG